MSVRYMNVPGIRHSSKCRRRWIEFQTRSLVGSRTALDAAVSDEERLERERSGAVVEAEAPIPSHCVNPSLLNACRKVFRCIACALIG